MREIASFEDERTAKLFADVLCARDIETEVSRGREGNFTVWVLAEQDVEASRAVWAAFDAKPDAPEYAALAGSVEKKQKKGDVEQRRSRHEVIDMRGRFRTVPRGPAVATLILVAVSVAVTIVITFTKRVDVVGWLSIGTSDEVANQTPFLHVKQGQIWRLFTPIFLHFGFLHILFNMWWLLDLGTVIENRIGTARFTTLVLLTAATSNAFQYVATGSPFFGGMSGVLYALFGYVWVRGRMDPTMGLAIPRSTVVVLMVWLVLGFTGRLGPVANYAHLGGLVAGALLGARATFRKPG